MEIFFCIQVKLGIMIQKAGFFGLQLSQEDLNFGNSNVGGKQLPNQ